MTERTFVPWVEPIAAQLRESRGEIGDVARAIPAEKWAKPSRDPNWSYKDLLAHLATGDWVVQTVLGAVVANEPLDLSFLDGLDAGNARLLAERAGRSIEELVAEALAEGEETQELLSRLTEADDDRRQEGAPMSLGEYLRMFPGHDQGHLADLRTALKG